MYLTIKEPFWKYKAFGIAEKELIGKTIIEVKCSYKKADGSLLYPHIYKMYSHKVACYQSMMIKGNKIHIVPVEAFEAQTN